MRTESHTNKISLLCGTVVFILYLFTFSMLSESKWRYVGEFGDGPAIFLAPIAYFIIGIMLVFWLISFCVSITKMIGDDTPFENQKDSMEILQVNLIRHLRIIGVALISIVALEIMPNAEASLDEELAFAIIAVIAFSIPLLITLFDFLLPKINSIFLPRWSFSGWFSIVGLGVLLSIPLSDMQQTSKFLEEFIKTFWALLSGSDGDRQMEYFLVSSVYLFLTTYYLYKIFVQWNKIRADLYSLFVRAKSLVVKFIVKK
ncbi:hypothetical protein [Echinimonas agarilytica]|uniref:Uncharacterized protein n=1 Tax=Echinimonas agarilytica TaxID=1215918 RepID=A0AA41W811_9GAMM|nr:hypothetical protein [Echinimonas agarilytica]MCM2680521.1 hypothetical protein [Echinimonas agarilytica]